MAKKSKQLADFFHDTLKDIYFAEKKVLAALPKVAKAADHGPKAGPILPDVPTLGLEAPCVARDLQSLDRDARPAILWRIKAAEMMAYT
jgi:hypothetical protein